jgi:transposase
MLARAGTPLTAAAETTAAEIRGSKVVASDETSARVEGKNWWQWVLVSSTAVHHLIADSRGAAVLTDFLGETKPDVWIADRYAAQAGHGSERQLCLAHLLRDAQYAIDAGDTVFAPKFKEFLKRACEIGRRRPDLADSTIRAYARTLERDLDDLLKLKPPNDEGRHLRDAMIADGRDKLLVFMTRRDVEPTNNACERTLRPSVIFRRVTNGFRSDWGAKAYADFCSIAATARLNGRSILAAIRAALTDPLRAIHFLIVG